MKSKRGWKIGLIISVLILVFLLFREFVYYSSAGTYEPCTSGMFCMNDFATGPPVGPIDALGLSLVGLLDLWHFYLPIVLAPTLIGFLFDKFIKKT